MLVLCFSIFLIERVVFVFLFICWGSVGNDG